jgi:mono/diheme cytochrome c family protein
VASADDAAWQARVAPVFQRVCAHCHLPGGDAGVDLSTLAAWTADRAEITRRVLVDRTMPPAGNELPDADRDALAAWLHAK